MKKTAGIGAVLVMVSAALALAAGMRTGKIVETMNAGSYTYMLLETPEGQVWVAGPETAVAVGDTVSVSQGMMMTDFTSKTLDRTFAEIYFVAKVVTPDDGPAASTHTGVKTAAVEKVTKADDGYTVAELLSHGATLDGKTVKVRGKVVKFTPEVMNTNWIHLQDGTGGDLTVTSSATVAVGDVIVVDGVLAADKDFGAGYKYDVIVEKAKVVVE